MSHDTMHTYRTSHPMHTTRMYATARHIILAEFNAEFKSAFPLSASQVTTIFAFSRSNITFDHMISTIK